MLTERIEVLKDFFFDHKHHGVRRTPESHVISRTFHESI